MEGKKVLLIVDDDEVIRENLVIYAKMAGYGVFEAANGKEALLILENEKPDLIVSDIEMPEMDGMQLLQELNERELEIPIVMMTGHGTIEYAINAMKSGAEDFLTKPLDLPYVKKIVIRVLERSAMEQKIKEQRRQLDVDLQHAALIQKRLLPKPIDTSSLSLHYRYEPMIDIGGDYLTVHQYNDSKIAVALYDVSGHGVSAAFTAHLVHSQLQMRLAEHRPPSNVIDLLNRFIIKTIEVRNIFLTIIIAIIDMEEGRMTVSNAGHPELYIWRNEQERLENISQHLPAVGIMQTILGDRNESLVNLNTGDRVMFYTDGFTESCNCDDEMLEYKGLKAMIERHSRLRPTDFLTKIFTDLDEYREGESEDDLTFVIVDIK